MENEEIHLLSGRLKRLYRIRKLPDWKLNIGRMKHLAKSNIIESADIAFHSFPCDQQGQLTPVQPTGFFSQSSCVISVNQYHLFLYPWRWYDVVHSLSLLSQWFLTRLQRWKTSHKNDSSPHLIPRSRYLISEGTWIDCKILYKIFIKYREKPSDISIRQWLMCYFLSVIKLRSLNQNCKLVD